MSRSSVAAVLRIRGAAVLHAALRVGGSEELHSEPSRSEREG